jgi:UDP-glucose 4-epimerase
VNKTAVVTGGAGFIGSHLVDLLVSKGIKVRVIDNLSGGRLENLVHLNSNSLVELIQKDIREITYTDATFKNVDYVFHLAGIGDIVPSIENPIEYFDINVQGTIKVLEASRLNNCGRLIYAASSSCYGLAQTPTDESHNIDPKYPYALSKFMGEQSVFHWGKVYGVEVNSICIFNAFGPRVRTKGVYGAVFGVFFKQKLAGKPLTVVGDGKQLRDFIYVTDVASAFLAAAETKKFGERFNIGAGKPQSILHLAEIIGGNIEFIPKRPGEPDITYANIEKARQMLGWSPKISFEKGVEIMMENIDDWEDAPLWDSSSIRETTKSWFKYMGKNDF